DTAREAGTPLVFVVSDGNIETAGTKYRKMWLHIGQVTDNRDTKGVGKIDVETFLGPCANAPTTVTVSGGGG
ncbi:MAG TPA: hypothetical protein VNQ76_02835, partial [Planctomicrobium sp.]|nr:hypothetical protein [Planctomicrobium sp.]